MTTCVVDHIQQYLNSRQQFHIAWVKFLSPMIVDTTFIW